jgi:hypothetical protein
LTFQKLVVGALGLCYTNNPDITKREVMMRSWTLIEEETQDHQIWSWGEVPHRVLWFHGCGVLGLFHANTYEITIREIPFWIKVVVTLVGHMGKSLCLVFV